MLAACRGSELYTQQDIQQVEQTYKQLHPIYESFKHAYLSNDTAGILQGYRREHAPCAVVDEIDNRDTIDPNIALFQASIALDDLCNAIESAYADWAIRHHRSYPTNIQPLRRSEVFIGAEADLKKINHQLAHPSALD
jgi:malate synthase